VARNDVLPRLGFRGDYALSGLADDLRNSLQQATTSNYTEWTVGLTLDYPIGNETARSGRNIAELQLARERARTATAEQNIAFQLSEIHSDLTAAWQRYQLAASQAADTQEWLRLARMRYSQPPASSAGRDLLLLELNDYQRAMRSWTEAVTTSGQMIAEVKTLEAQLQEVEGTAVLYWTSGFRQESGEQPGSAEDSSSTDRTTPQ